eukprot:CAMPEP_0177776202 /NCGR_PEP_ID=MMETSP0491_2-20121128/14578_1 /TAXON_ID=63592 /ORGANISM="Tetraselmis chuii, Strain PLY429" /LENGTH=224 /DNA_ID=CAMNT_0019294959 /DNA_START=273 /DNA_END=945 /DNA_ORIENTATION=+
MPAPWTAAWLVCMPAATYGNSALKRKEAGTSTSEKSKANRKRRSPSAAAAPPGAFPAGAHSAKSHRPSKRAKPDTVAKPGPSKHAAPAEGGQATGHAAWGRSASVRSPRSTRRGKACREEKGKQQANTAAAAAASNPMERPGRGAHHPPNDHSPSGSDEEDDLGGDDYGRNLASASTALSFGHSSGRLKGILANLKKDESPQQMEALSQLCELLSISTEEALST